MKDIRYHKSFLNTWIDYSNLPHKKMGNKQVVDWNRSVNYTINFRYKNITGELKILDSIGKKLIIEYNNSEFEILKDVLSNVGLGFIIGQLSYNFKYDIGEIIDRKYGKLLIKEQKHLKNKNSSTSRGYNVTCLICGYNFDITEGHIDEGNGCSVCSGHIGLNGYNMMADTHPHIATLLLNPDDGHKYKIKSNKKLDWKCPYCGEIIYNKRPYEVEQNGLCCPNCSDGISYPNKFIRNILTQIGVDFESEKRFDWCIFNKFQSNEQTYGIYDIVIEDKKLIIEMDGGLGHGKSIHSKSKITIEESLYKDKIKDKLAKEHGYKIIRIDVSYNNNKNRKQICKNQILYSELSSIFDINTVDWDKADIESNVSNFTESYKYWNYGWGTRDISKKLNIDLSTVINYLNQAKDSGLCDYDKAKSKERQHAKLDKILNTDSYLNENDTYRKTRKQIRIEILSEMIRNGYTVAQIAEKYNISRRNVESYVKLGVMQGLCENKNKQIKKAS